MITKKMHTMAQPIAAAAGMREIARGRGTGCSRKTAAFAKEIIDKYTKRLDHPFDPVSLVFLERMANGSGSAGAGGAMVMVTCRLLSYLIQNAGQAGLFSDRHSFLVQQLAGQVEQNLEVLKDSAAAAGRELGRCYLEYQKVIILDGNARMEQISNLQERMHRFEQIQTQYDPLRSAQARTRQLSEPEGQQGRKPEENRMPLVMTHAFFANLNHWVRENKPADHRQMWKLANVRQMVQQKLKYHMQRFLREEDFIKQEEQLSDMIWQYGKDAVLEYLEQADLKVYEKLLPVLHTLSGRSGGSGSQEHRSADQSGSSRLERENAQNSGREYRNADGRYPAAVTEQLLAEFQAAAVQMEQLLAEADEETKALLQETAAEYKKYFLEYVRAVSGIQRVSAAKETAGWQESQMPAGVSQAFRDRSREHTGMQVQTEEDQEVFSDAEIELLLQKEAGKRASAETDAAELKLKLLAYREIAEQFQQEGSTVLHRETLQKITKLLDQDSFLYSRRLAEYQKADEELSKMIAGSDDITKNMLLEKAEEYQNLFYRYIRTDHAKQETAADEMFQMEHPAASDDGMLWMSVVQSGEYKTLFSDRELALLLQDDEAGRMPDSEALERKAAEYKLDLLAYRETVHRILQETAEKEAADQEVQQDAALLKQKVTHIVYQKEALHKMLQLLARVPFIRNAGETFKEYQIIETQLVHILSDCNEITKNVLQDKVREYQDLFTRRIQTGDQAVKIKEADTEIFSDTERKLLRETGDGLVSEERQAAEQKLRLLAYREIAKQLLKEGDTVLQREKLQKIVQLFSGSGRQIEPLAKEAARNVVDVRGILEHGSLPERKLLFLTAEKTIDELLIRLQEAGNDGPWNAAEQAAENAENRQHIRDLVRLKNQLMQVNGQAYRGTDDWGFLLTNEAGSKLLRILQQEKNPMKDVWKQKVQQSLTDFYHRIREEGFCSQESEDSSFFAEWNPVFRQEEWRQLRSLVRNQPGREHHEKRVDHRNLPDQIQPENACQHLRPEQRASERRSFRESAGRELEPVSMGQSIERELESVLADRGEKMRQAIPGSRYLQNKYLYYGTKQLRKDIWKKTPDRLQQLTQYQAFMQPPVQDAPVKAAAAHTQQRTEDTVVWQAPREQAAIVHTQQHTKDTAQLQRIAEEKEQQQKQELQRLEGSLLDYRSELQGKTAQLDQVEKKLAAQDKELKLVRDSQHAVRKQGKTAAERRQMFNQLKAELQLERMRSGYV